MNERECADANGEVCRLRSRIDTLAKALDEIRDAGPCECGPVSAEGDVIGEHGACYIGIADRALAAITRALTGEGAK